MCKVAFFWQSIIHVLYPVFFSRLCVNICVITGDDTALSWSSTDVSDLLRDNLHCKLSARFFFSNASEVNLKVFYFIFPGFLRGWIEILPLWCQSVSCSRASSWPQELCFYSEELSREEGIGSSTSRNWFTKESLSLSLSCKSLGVKFGQTEK